MSRSVHVENYSDIYWQLRDAARGALPRVELKLTVSQAMSKRQSFYNFIGALERDSERHKRAGNITLAEERLGDAKALRGYKAQIFERDGTTIADTKDNRNRPCILAFINRSLDPDEADLRKQLARQLSNIRPVEDVKPLPAQEVSGFFDQPLQTPEDKDDAANS